PEQKVLELSRLNLSPSDDLKPLWPVRESEPEWVNDPSLGIYLELARPFTWTVDMLVSPEAVPGQTTIAFSIKLQVCDNSTCQWGTHYFAVPLTIKNDTPSPAPADVAKRSEGTMPAPRVLGVPPDLKKSSPTGGGKGGGGDEGLLAFILQGVFWGAVSLITP